MPVYNLRKGTVQYKFANSRAKMQFFGGGYGNGKTTASVVTKALTLANYYPGSNGLIARATYPKLNDTIRKEFFKWCPPDWIKRMPTLDDNTCYLVNGSVVNFRYVSQRGKQNPDGTSTSNLLSATYDWIIVDQIEDPEIGHKDLLDLMGRLRGQTNYRPPPGDEDPSMPSTGPRWLILTANPTGNWVYQKIVKPYLYWKKTGIVLPELLWDKAANKPIMELFEGPTHGNAENLPPDYLEGMEALYKGQYYDRYVLGKWASYEGLVHAELTEENNGLTRVQMEQHIHRCLRRHVKLRAIESYDYGLVSPSCLLIGFVDDWGRVFVIDGFYKKNFHYEDQVVERARLMTKYSHLIDFTEPIKADPAIWKTHVVAKVRDTADTIATLLMGKGWDITPASNEIMSGIGRVNGYIAGRPQVPHPITGKEGAPLFYVANELTWLWEEVQAYYWKKNPNGENIDEPMDDNDHAMNSMKYMLSHLPEPSEIELPDHLKPKPWMFWQEEGGEEAA